MITITSIREINTTTQEGKLLVAALAQLSTELSLSPDDVLQNLAVMAQHIYEEET